MSFPFYRKFKTWVWLEVQAKEEESRDFWSFGSQHVVYSSALVRIFVAEPVAAWEDLEVYQMVQRYIESWRLLGCMSLFKLYFVFWTAVSTQTGKK